LGQRRRGRNRIPSTLDSGGPDLSPTSSGSERERESERETGERERLGRLERLGIAKKQQFESKKDEVHTMPQNTNSFVAFGLNMQVLYPCDECQLPVLCALVGVLLPTAAPSRSIVGMLRGSPLPRCHLGHPSTRVAMLPLSLLPRCHVATWIIVATATLPHKVATATLPLGSSIHTSRHVATATGGSLLPGCHVATWVIVATATLPLGSSSLLPRCHTTSRHCHVATHGSLAAATATLPLQRCHCNAATATLPLPQVPVAIDAAVVPWSTLPIQLWHSALGLDSGQWQWH
jgi:hypothetical protein